MVLPAAAMGAGLVAAALAVHAPPVVCAQSHDGARRPWLLQAAAAARPAPASPVRPGSASPQVDPPAPLPAVDLPAPLDRVLRDYERAWSARDARALAALFTDDGFVLSGGHPPVRGRGAIERHYAGRGGLLALRALAFATDGSVGWIVGGYARVPGEPDRGKFTLTLRRSPDGRWLIASDMDNANAPRPD